MRWLERIATAATAALRNLALTFAVVLLGFAVPAPLASLDRLLDTSATTVSASTYIYDANATPRLDTRAVDRPETWATDLNCSQEGSASPSAGPLGTSTTPVARSVATNSRGLSNLGGVIEQTGTNAAGGRVFTSTGTINQNDFAGIVNSRLMRGDDVHIFTGAHGTPSGSVVPDASLLADDVARFGDLPGVTVHDLPTMSPAEVQAILDGPGTIIGGFCNSGACLSRVGR